MTENALAKYETSLPAGIDEAEVEGLTGLGYSERADDSLIPILALLQDNSAEVKKKHERHIEGAEAGHLIVRSLRRVIDTEKEVVLFQPAGFQRVWVRWEGEPGEGVVIGQYPFDDRPSEAEEVEDAEGRKNWVMPDGSRLVDTRYHFGFLEVGDVRMPMVVPMGGTNHTVSRQWTTLMKNKKFPSGAPIPAWFCAYRIRTEYRSRGVQSWFTYKVEEIGFVSDRAQRDAGRALFESLQKGEVAAATDDAPTGDAADAATDRVADDIPI